MGIFIAGIQRNSAPRQGLGRLHRRSWIGRKAQQGDVMIDQRQHHVCLSALWNQGQSAFKKGFCMDVSLWRELVEKAPRPHRELPNCELRARRAFDRFRYRIELDNGLDRRHDISRNFVL